MSKTLSYFQQKKLNPADELRERLTALEAQLPRLRRLDAPQALAMLHDLDHAQQLFMVLEERGVELTSERGLFDSIQNRLRKGVGRILRAVGGKTVLHHHRPTPEPSHDERWWWYLDEMVAAERQQRLRQWLIMGGIITAIFGAVFIALQTVLAPDPLVLARFRLQERTVEEIQLENYEAALVQLNEGLIELGQTDGPLLLLRGIAQEKLNRLDEAEQSYAEAKTAYNDPVSFHLGRAQTYLEFEEPAKAESEARAALDLNQESAVAWLLLGQALEYQAAYFKAGTAYETAGDLAFEQGHNELVVMARLALGRLGTTGPPLSP